MSTANPPTTPPKSQSDGFWDSLSPEDQKKYTLVFLISIGTTLLVTGRTAGSALKRSQTSSSTPITPTPPSAPTIPTLISQTSRSIKKPKFLSSTPPPPPTPSQSRPEPPSASFLHPNSLVLPPPRKRLLPSFVTRSPSSSKHSPSPSPSSYFLPNSTLTETSTAYASELDRLDKLHEDGEPSTVRLAQESMLAEPGFNPAIYAAKALGIATAITFSAFGFAIWGTMKWLGVDDMEGLSLALSHRLAPTLEATRPSLPSWAQPREKCLPTPEELRRQEREEAENDTTREELSYWREVKDTLDREAEERKRDRKERWDGLRKRAGLTTSGSELEVKRV